MIGKQVLAFGKSEKSEFINIGIFGASSGGRKGRLHIGRFTPDRERSHVWFLHFLDTLLPVLWYSPISWYVAKNLIFSTQFYCKSPKNLDTRKTAVLITYPKIWTMWLYYRIMCPKVADRIANSVDPEEQSHLGLPCLPRPVCPKT